VHLLKTLYNVIVDALFPLSPSEAELLTYSPAHAYETLPRAASVPIDSAQAVFAYKDERVSKLIWSIKYKKSLKATELGGYALYQKLLEMNLPQGTMVIPIPISARRRRERGYNQCELLAKEIERLDTDHQFGYNDQMLKRTHHLARQTLKGRKERLESAQGIFEVTPSLPLPSPLVVIDDVITTGSTMKEAIETLKKSGYTNVTGLSLAH
jgi:ComF family protein